MFCLLFLYLQNLNVGDFQQGQQVPFFEKGPRYSAFGVFYNMICYK